MNFLKKRFRKKIKYFCLFIFLIFIILNINTIFFIIYFNYLNNFVDTFEIEMENNTLYLNGIINSKSFDSMVEKFEENPNITTLVFEDIEGSIDDDTNLEMASWLALKNLTTKIFREKGHITSGGTDLFFVGDKRIVQKGAKIGVHSWDDESGIKATNYPKNSEVHKKYIDFYIKTGLNEKEAREFYFFTLNSASADEMYYLNNTQILKYKVGTKLIE